MRPLRSIFVLVPCLVLSSGCGEAPPPPVKAAPPRTIRVHVTNASRFDVCRVEACGAVGRPVDASGPLPASALKPHQASLYEVKACAGSLKAVACADDTGQTPCLKADGGRVDDGAMFRVQPCSL